MKLEPVRCELPALIGMKGKSSRGNLREEPGQAVSSNRDLARQAGNWLFPYLTCVQAKIANKINGGKLTEKHTAVAKALVIFRAFSARLKPCPDTKQRN
jgi:hypothetical protein